jgi:hypothetical protein
MVSHETVFIIFNCPGEAASRRGTALLGRFTLRRCQILLASSHGQRPFQITKNLRCVTQTVRNALRAFHSQGLECLKESSSRPKTVQP